MRPPDNRRPPGGGAVSEDRGLTKSGLQISPVLADLADYWRLPPDALSDPRHCRSWAEAIRNYAEARERWPLGAKQRKTAIYHLVVADELEARAEALEEWAGGNVVSPFSRGVG